MLYDKDKILQEYNASISSYRVFYQLVFSILTFGLGALWLLLTSVVVRDGEVAIREDLDGNFQVLPPGRHCNFPWESYVSKNIADSETNNRRSSSVETNSKIVVSLGDKYIKMGTYKFITVESGYVAKTTNKGKLVIFGEGQHIVKEGEHIFHSFLPVKQETRRLDPVSVVTSDGVALDVEADVIFKIEDAKLAISEVDDVEKYILEQAQMQLSNVIGRRSRMELITRNNSMVDNPDTSKVSCILDELKKSLSKALDDKGIKLVNLGIRSLQVTDRSLAHEIAQGAVLEAQTNSKLKQAEQQANVMKIKAAAEAKVNEISTQALIASTELLKEKPLAKQLAILKAYENIAAGSQNTNMFFNLTQDADLSRSIATQANVAATLIS